VCSITQAQRNLQEEETELLGSRGVQEQVPGQVGTRAREPTGLQAKTRSSRRAGEKTGVMVPVSFGILGGQVSGTAGAAVGFGKTVVLVKAAVARTTLRNGMARVHHC